MKRFFSVLLACAVLLGLCSCKKDGQKVTASQADEIYRMQDENIKTLGNSASKEKIVCFVNANEYVKYTVSEYYENGKKKSETANYYYINEDCFKMDAEKLKDVKADINNELWLISISENFFDTGAYKTDLEKAYAETFVI